MLDETLAKFISQNLNVRRSVLTGGNVDVLTNLNKAIDLMDAIARGETIASLWSLDDVYSANGDCVIEQISKDGEDDGLTWYHCETHDQDTLDTQFCEDHPPILTEPMAKRVLQLMDREHDASIGINWDTIGYWIEYVRENN